MKETGMPKSETPDTVWAASAAA